MAELTLQRLQRSLKHRVNLLMDQKWFNLGLRAKMGVLVTTGLTGLLVVFGFLGISNARQTTQQVMHERMILAHLSAVTLDTTLNHIEEMLASVAQLPTLRDSQGDIYERQDIIGNSTISGMGIHLLDTTGTVQLPVRDEHAHPVVDWHSVAAVQSILKGNPIGLTIVNTPQPWIVVAVPVNDDQGELIGALAMMLDLTSPEVFPLEQPANLGGSGTIDIVDPNGTVLVSTDSSRAMKESAEEGILGRLFEAAEAGVDTCLGCDPSGPADPGDEVVAFAPLSKAPLGVIVRQPAEEVLAPVRRLIMQNFILGSASIVGALALVWITTNSVIEPVQSLTQAASRIAAGDLTTPIEQPPDKWLFGRRQRSDEIGELARSFDRMRYRIKEYMDEIQIWNRELDSRVQERTREALEAQREAQVARDDLRAVTDALSDELVVIDVEDYKIQQVNQAAQRKYAHQGDLIGKYCYDMFHGGKPCQLPDCECPIPQVLANGKSVKVTHVRACEDNGHKCYFDIVSSPMYDASGRIARVVELIRDVTKEKEIEESLLHRNQQLSILNALAMTVNTSLNLEEILERALVEVLRLTGIDVGAIFLLDDALGKLELKVCKGLSEDTARMAAQIGLLDGACGGVVERGEVVMVPDLSRFRGRRARALQRNNIKSLVHVPLASKGYILGSMCVGVKQMGEISEEEQELLIAIGNQIAVAVENAHLYAEVQHKEQVRGELFKKAINVQEEERKRIARELHDETSQALTALIYATEESLDMEDLGRAKQRMQSMLELTQRILDGVHKIIFDLRPSMLDHLGLVPAIRWLAQSRLDPQVAHVTIEESSPPLRLSPEIETALFRVIQEAVANVARHAAARNVCISFNVADDNAFISIKDDGIGFDINALAIEPDTGRGLGLLGMEERVELLGGELEIQTAPGQGTQILIQVPLDGRRVTVG